MCPLIATVRTAGLMPFGQLVQKFTGATSKTCFFPFIEKKVVLKKYAYLVSRYITDLRANSFCIRLSRDAIELRCRESSTVARYLEGSEAEPQPK